MRRMLLAQGVGTALVVLTTVTLSSVVADAGPLSAEHNGRGRVSGFAAADDSLAPDSDWHVFQFGVVGSVSGPFTFTIEAGELGKVTVADAFCIGDRFSVADNGTTLGSTSEVVQGSCPDGFDRDNCAEAAADDRYSTAAFYVAPGAHTVEVTTIASPFGSGGACIRVDTVSLTKADCKSSWQLYSLFKSRGACVSFVVTAGARS